MSRYNNTKYDSQGYPVVYTDGACLNNGRDGAQAGVGVYWGDNHPMNVSEPVRGRQTNNTAEIQAVTRAIEGARAQGYDRVHIKTDSHFTYDCVNNWMPNWKRNGWRKADGGSVVNRSDLERLDNAMQGMDVKWEHVRGHNGDRGNAAADQLAKQGARGGWRY